MQTSSIYSVNGQENEKGITNGGSSSKAGWKTYLVQDQVFEVPERYELLHLIGRGAFGTVCSAHMKKPDGTQERVAVKKILIREDNILEVRRLVRELYLLRHFDHDNIISLRDVIEPVHPEKFDELYICTDLMDTDLNQVIRSKQGLSEDHVRFFIFQLLRGLKAIHSAAVLHRDLKPSNIVVNANCDLNICDFGLAREQDLVEGMTDYVATRWYRAPELLMQWKNYSGSVDVWSVGCIFAELLARKPVFPGKNYLDQLHIILDLVGTPTEEDIDGIGSEKARNYVRHLPKREKRDFKKLFPTANKLAIDLLEKMLVFDPHRRWTAKECLQHEYFAVYEEPNPPDAQVFDWSVDISDETLTVFDLKKMLFDMLLQFHPEYAEFKWWTNEELAIHERQKKEKIEAKAAKEAAAAASK